MAVHAIYKTMTIICEISKSIFKNPRHSNCRLSKEINQQNIHQERTKRIA